MHTKFIFVTGGVVSSLGKGITAASLGRLLKSRGLRVSMQKFDPYINVDPGTMNPYQHGEVFVTDDGAETDLDLGHYERFIDENLTQAANVTSGRVYDTVITRERKGEYLGATIQVIPHITDEIKRRMLAVSLREDAPDVVITEIGGTVGDIESLPFLEAARQLKNEVGRENVLYIHVTLVPYISAAGELKTKPTQHSVKELTGLGIQPDIIVCRSEKALTRDVRAKIGLFCNIPADCVFENLNARSIYEVPLMIHEEGMDERVCRLLGIPAPEADLTEWRGMVERLLTPERDVRIAIVGKYVELPDAYLSIVEALTHGGIAHHAKVRVEWVAAESVTPENAAEKLAGCGGVLVPGGFGERGLEGKIAAVQYAREHGVPFLGICLGMQMAVVEYARHVLGLEDANSEEFDKLSEHKVIYLMTEWYDVHTNKVEERDETSNKGHTMRLGAYPCKIIPETKAAEAYGQPLVQERHRHRYEFNNAFRDALGEKGLVYSGMSPDESLVEIVELKDHPWFLGCQFHPEFRSRPMAPHPLFREFIKAAKNQKALRQGK